MALTDTEDFFRLSVIAMPKRRSIFDFREQRAKQPCLHGYLATAATECVARSDWRKEEYHYCKYGIHRCCEVQSGDCFKA